MSEDARFEEGRETPLHLGAIDADDVRVIASLTQDAVFPITEMSWKSKERRFAILLNRFRWEDAGRARHGAERVQSILAIDCVLAVASYGIDRSERDTVLSLLGIEIEPLEDGAAFVVLTFAGDGALRLKVEVLDITLKDVTRPYLAPSGKTPDHEAEP